MSVNFIQERLDSYNSQSVQEEENAIREIMQEVVLGALSRTEFFKHAAFQGGTCLRIVYGLERFSEDLDFVLIQREKAFNLNKYLDGLDEELKAYGFDCSLKDRKDMAVTVQKQFVKDNSLVKLLHFQHFKPGKDTKNIRIKFEVDTNPPSGSKFETKFHDFPYTYEIALQDMKSLFASKSHALLCRTYVKGRDWYDFLWYVGRKAKINYDLLSAAIDQKGPWRGKAVSINKEWYLKEMEKKIKEIDFKEAKGDVQRFIKPSEQKSLELWSERLFLDRLEKLSSIL